MTGTCIICGNPVPGNKSHSGIRKTCSDGCLSAHKRRANRRQKRAGTHPLPTRTGLTKEQEDREERRVRILVRRMLYGGGSW